MKELDKKIESFDIDGVEIEFDPEEAEECGAFEEKTIDHKDTEGAAFDDKIT